VELEQEAARDMSEFANKEDIGMVEEEGIIQNKSC
jgi:hypothetical protein